MTLADTLTITNVLRLTAALFLFAGPGLAIAIVLGLRDRFDRTCTIVLAYGLSLSFWAILLAWLELLGIRLGPWLVLAILVLGWTIALVFRGQSIPTIHTPKPSIPLSRIALWSFVALTVGTGLWALRGVVTGLGSDSYHHTLIAQLILDSGGLPQSYAPYAPLVTFRYHYGFHAWIAVMAWLTGMEPRVLVPVLGGVLLGFCALSTGFLAESVTRSRVAAPIAAGITGLVSVFPAFYVNWGRYPQLAGLALTPIFLGMLWIWIDEGVRGRFIPLLGVLAAGIALTHYRVTLMTALGAATIILTEGLLRKKTDRWRMVPGIVKMAALALLLGGPWLWHVARSWNEGFPVAFGSSGPSFFSLDRLGQNALAFPTNAALIGITIAALLTGAVLRNFAILEMAVYALGLVVFSGPRFSWLHMDTVTVVMSLYFPAAVVIAAATVDLARKPRYRFRLLPSLAAAGGMVLLTVGAYGHATIVEPGAGYVTQADMAAMAWIRDNVPKDALFMVNTYHFGFNDRYVISIDAGYWIPLLADRQTVTAPMIYPAERAATPDFLDGLVALDRLNGGLTTPHSLGLLEQMGVTHVFVGRRGGLIDVEALLSSPQFVREYSADSVYVFRITYPAAHKAHTPNPPLQAVGGLNVPAQGEPVGHGLPYAPAHVRPPS